MKVFIVLAAFAVAVASAGRSGYGGSEGNYGSGSGPNSGYGAAVSTGTSSQFRSSDDYGNYNFGYDESHATGGSSRREEETNGVRRGSYSLTDADGRRRVVNYVADAHGFRATVETNEPGVEAKNPADVIINKQYSAIAAAPRYASPVAEPLAQPNGGYGASRSYGRQTQMLPPLAPPAPRSYSAPSPFQSFGAQSYGGQSYGGQSYGGQSNRAQGQSYGGQSYGAQGQSYGGQSYGAQAQSYGAQTQSYGGQTQSYGAPAQSYGAQAQSYGAQAPAQSYGGQSYGAQSYEAPTPLAFSYSFSDNHLVTPRAYAAQSYSAPAQTYSAPAQTYSAQAPVYQQRQEY